jgi:hypothetical protein
VPLIPDPNQRPENRRRSQRLKVRIAVEVRLQKPGKKSLPEKTNAISVNAHGGLVLLATHVEIDQLVVVKNVASNEELLGRVTSLGDTFMGKTQVAVEFILPVPDFWGVASIPKDWKSLRR